MLALIVAAVQNGDQVVVLVPTKGPITELIQDAAPAAAILVAKFQWWMGSDHTGIAGTMKLVHAWVQVPRVAMIIRRVNPDVVYLMSTVLPGPLLARAFVRSPLVVFQSESIRDNPTLRSAIPKAVVARLVNRLADVTVGVSDYAAQQYGGADLIEAPDVQPSPGSQLTATTGVPESRRATPARLRAVMLGSLSTEKGQYDAVRAVALARERGADVSLDLYGNVDRMAMAELLTLVSTLRLEREVRHHGTTAEPLEALRAGDLSLVCSRNEAYGRVTAESLLVGTPVIAYALGGTVEILQDGGGVGVSPSPQAMAEELVRVALVPGVLDDLQDAATARSRSGRGFGDAGRTLSVIDAALSD